MKKSWGQLSYMKAPKANKPAATAGTALAAAAPSAVETGGVVVELEVEATGALAVGNGQ